MEGICRVSEVSRLWARRWLLLAVSAVAVSGVFAILIALARVPALGSLFPGSEFYRVALVLHVNLSQGVWFMAFAGVLWSLHVRGGSEHGQRWALLLAACGTFGIVLAVSAGDVRPLMSNYLPVLDSRLFFASLGMFGGGIVLKALIALRTIDPGQARTLHGLGQLLLLRLSVFSALMVFVLLAVTAGQMTSGEGVHFYEMLFWGPGHLWQFALLQLLMFSWLALLERQEHFPPIGVIGMATLFSLIPVLLSLGIPLLYPVDGAESSYLYTWLMQWTSWQGPLLLALAILSTTPGNRLAFGFRLSFMLFAAGLLIGTQINGQTTLITAHYHGTIGAITLAFMALAFRLLSLLGMEEVPERLVRRQLGFYGYGIFLMMAGLAGAGLMGAPRKTPGDLALTFSVETFSRICLGFGGLCATVGIVMFAWLLLRRLLPASTTEAYLI